jgi:hypothetical protein
VHRRIRPSLTNVYLVAATATLCLVTPALLASEASPAMELFGDTAPLVAVLVWLGQYARDGGIVLPYDWGVLWWAAWPIAVPLYSIRLEGRRGWRLAGVLLLLSVGPALAAEVVVAIRGR